MEPIQFTLYDGMFSTLPGIYKRENPRPLDHHFHIIERGPGELLTPMVVPRDRYRCFELGASMVNVGGANLLFPNYFNRPDLYLRTSLFKPDPNSKHWAVGNRFLSMAVDEFRTNWTTVGWDIMDPGSSQPPNTGVLPLWAGMSSGVGSLVLPEAMGCSVDITDMADGQHTVFLELTDGSQPLATFQTNIITEGFNVSLA